MVAIDPSVVLDAVKFAVEQGKAAYDFAVGKAGVVEIPESNYSVKSEDIVKKIAEESKVAADQHPYEIAAGDPQITQFAYLKKAAASVSLGNRWSGKVPEYGMKAADLMKDKKYNQLLYCVPIAVKWAIDTLVWEDVENKGENVSWISEWEIHAGSSVTPYNDHNNAATFAVTSLTAHVKPSGVLLEAGWHFDNDKAELGKVYKRVNSVGSLKFAVGMEMTSEGADAAKISIG